MFCDVSSGDPNTGPPVPKASTLPSLPLLQHHVLRHPVSHTGILISQAKSQSGHRMLSNLEGALVQILQLLWEFVELWANMGKTHGSDIELLYQDPNADSGQSSSLHREGRSCRFLQKRILFKYQRAMGSPWGKKSNVEDL